MSIRSSSTWRRAERREPRTKRSQQQSLLPARPTIFSRPAARLPSPADARPPQALPSFSSLLPASRSPFSRAACSLKRRELDKTRHEPDGLIEAIAEGFRAPGLQARRGELALHRVRLEAEIDGAPVAAPRQHGTTLRCRRAPWGWALPGFGKIGCGGP